MHNHWVYTNYPSTRVRVLMNDPDYEKPNVKAEEDTSPPLPPPGEEETGATPAPAPAPSPGSSSSESEDSSDSDTNSDSDKEDDMAKDAKISAPDDFKGEASKFQEFITSCELYFAANPEGYTTNDKKIIFALSYMKGETAGAWKTVFLDKVNGPEEEDNDDEEEGLGISLATPKKPEYGTWKDFKVQIRREFKHAAQEIQSQFDLDSFRQGNMNTTDYVTKFKVKGNNAKVTFLQRGLNPALCTKIYSTFPLPETFKEWCERASNVSNTGNHN